MKSRRVKRRQVKRTKRKGSGPNKCGVLNEGKSLADNIRNCLKNKDIWEHELFPKKINCTKEDVQTINYPSNPECMGDIVSGEFR